MRSVVITGVSTGIGYGAACELCRTGYRVFGSVRDAGAAERLQAELGPSFIPLLFDVTDAGAIAGAAAQVRDEIGDAGLFGLINNAGIAINGPLTTLSPADLMRQFEVNVVGVVNAVQAFLPLLRAARAEQGRAGRIVNIGSLSGRVAYPFMGPYAASKHALEAISDSLRRELLIYGVDVILIRPGDIDTPIWDKGANISTAFAATDYAAALRGIDLLAARRKALPVARVTGTIVRALTAKRPRARYVIPDDWLRRWILPRLLPDRQLDRIIDRMLGFQKIRDDLA